MTCRRTLSFFGIWLLVFAMGSAVSAKTVITFSSQFTDRQDAAGDLWRSIIQQFNDSQDHIHVEIVAGGGNVAVQNERMLAGIAAGRPTDVFEFHGGNHGSWASQGILADLIPLLERDADIEFEDFHPAVIDTYKRTGSGRLYALPVQIQTYVLEYNEDMFQTAGLDRPSTSWDDPSWHWESFVELGKKLMRYRSGSDQPDQYAFHARRDVTGGLLTYVWQSGGDVVNDDGEFTLDSPEAIRAIQYVVDLRHGHGIATTGGFPRTSAMRISVPAGYPGLLGSYPDVNWDLAPLPRGPVRSATVLGSTPMGISAFSPNQDAAWTFYKYMMSPDVLTRLIMIADHVPVRRSVTESDAFRSIVTPPGYLVAVEAISHAYNSANRGPNWNQIAPILQTAVDRAWEGGVPVESAIEEVRPTVEGLLRDGWERQIEP